MKHGSLPLKHPFRHPPASVRRFPADPQLLTVNERYQTIPAILNMRRVGLFTDSLQWKPYRLLKMALLVSLLTHLLIFAAAGNIFQRSHFPVPVLYELQVRLVSVYRPDPVPISGTVITNAHDATSSARIKTSPTENPVNALVATHVPLPQSGQKSRGEQGNGGGGHDCRVKGFNFCSSL